MKTRSRARRLLLLLLVLGAPASARAQDSASVTLRALLAGARHPWARWPDFPRHVDVVGRLYASRGMGPLWTAGGALRPPARRAIAELLAAPAEGLDARDYDAAVLDSLARGIAAAPPAERARFDVLLTVDLIRYLDDVRRGRLQEHPLSGRPRPPGPDLAALMAAAVAGDSLSRLVHALEPQLAQYRSLRSALARYRALAADPGLAPVPEVGVLRPGAQYAGLPALRRLLVAFGDLPPGDAASDTTRTYAGPVVAALRRFQQRHALAPDGLLGPATAQALNTPVAVRVRQIELALERLRWVPPVGNRRLLIVNIPAFQLVAFDSATGPGPPALAMRVVVGKAMDTRTPVLLEELRYVDFRPYWNVPRSIVVKELIPILRRRPRYLRATEMEIVGPGDRVLGDTVTAQVLGRLARGELRVRQRPGPRNALGLAKFVFPNAASVYLHGTPEAELFSRARRDFSHGCIRVEDPAALALWVLGDRPDGTRDRVEAAMAAPASSRVLLTRPLPVLVFYTTAVVHADGSVWFYPDVYGHDQELLEALRAGPEPP